MPALSIGSKEWKQLVYDGAREMGVALEMAMAGKMAAHCIELIRWNQKVNLTAITDPMDVAVKHVLDSLAAYSLLPDGASVLDLGSGGGFPGLVLKIANPGLSVVMVDASRKKVSFLKHVIRSIKLKDIEAYHIRADDLAKNSAFVNAFDIIVSRALSAMDTLVETALPLLAKKGMIIALKGIAPEAEIESMRSLIIKRLRFSEINSDNLSVIVKNYTLPYLEIARSLVTVRKLGSSPN